MPDFAEQCWPISLIDVSEPFVKRDGVLSGVEEDLVDASVDGDIFKQSQYRAAYSQAAILRAGSHVPNLRPVS